MKPQLYLASLFGIACLLFYFGIHLIIGKMPSKLKKSAYHISRAYMGSAYVVVALSIMIFFSCKLYHLSDNYRHAYNLSIYFCAATLMAISFMTLIDNKPGWSAVKYKYRLLSILIYPAPHVCLYNLG